MEKAISDAKTAAVAQGLVDAANAKVTAVKNIKADYDTATWDGIISAQQLLVDQKKNNEVRAEEVIELIETLPAVNLVKVTDKEEIEKAREAYNLLTEEQKNLVTNVAKLVAVEEALKKAIEQAPIYTGKVEFKATPNGSIFSTTKKEINFSMDDKGKKLIKISMGDGIETFEKKVGNFTITEETFNGKPFYRVITEHEFYASTKEAWRVAPDAVDVTKVGTVRFNKTGGPFLSIESNEFYKWFTKK